MKIALFDPYIGAMGGGEKVLLSIVQECARSEHDVLLISPEKPKPEDLERLQIDLDPTRVRWRRAGERAVAPLTVGRDLFVALSNGIPPMSFAGHSAAIVQFPYESLSEGPSRFNQVPVFGRKRRLDSYDQILCYSGYVADAIRDRLKVAQPTVIYAPIDLPEAPPPGGKADKVVAVGRFFPKKTLNNKNHDTMIRAWRELSAEPEAAGWELHLAGGLYSDAEHQAHFESLIKLAADSPGIHFHPNASSEELSALYSESALFWHAAGYGEHGLGQAEHFGITTVEAMAYGSVPVVAGFGGQLEIVSDDVNGRTWQDIPQLIAATRTLMGDPERRARLSSQAVIDAQQFSRERFLERVRDAVLRPAGVA